VKSLENIEESHNPGVVDGCPEILVEHVKITGNSCISPTGWLTKANPSKYIAKTSVKQVFLSVARK